MSSLVGPAQIIPVVQQPSSEGFPMQRYRPGPLADAEADLGMKTAYDRVDTLEHTRPSVPSVLNGSRMSSGAIQVTGSVKGVATGLSTLSNVIAGVDSGSAPNNLTVTATPSTTVPGTFDVYVWKPTSSGDNTPILNTVPATVRWHAWGT